jgi:hypothetical protein
MVEGVVEGGRSLEESAVMVVRDVVIFDVDS